MSAHGEAAHAVHKDYEGAKIGMWLFLFTEVLLFGGLFILYAAYRSMYSAEFAQAASQLNVFLGVFNTVILLTSSLTMLHQRAYQPGKQQAPGQVAIRVSTAPQSHSLDAGSPRTLSRLIPRLKPCRRKHLPGTGVTLHLGQHPHILAHPPEVVK